jgi:hypothetical protein
MLHMQHGIGRSRLGPGGGVQPCCGGLAASNWTCEVCGCFRLKSDCAWSQGPSRATSAGCSVWDRPKTWPSHRRPAQNDDRGRHPTVDPPTGSGLAHPWVPSPAVGSAPHPSDPSKGPILVDDEAYDGFLRIGCRGAGGHEASPPIAPGGRAQLEPVPRFASSRLGSQIANLPPCPHTPQNQAPDVHFRVAPVTEKCTSRHVQVC